MSLTRARIAFALTIVLVSASRPAWPDGGIDIDTMKMYGGTYVSDCKNPASPRVTISKDALVFIRGDKRVAVSNAQVAYSYYGQSPPENYVTTFLGDAPRDEQMILTLYEDANGRHLTIDASGALAAQIGKPALALKYRRCDAPAKGAATTQPAPSLTPAPSTGALPGAAELAHEPAFKKAYWKALGRLTKEDWLVELDGPSPETRKVTVAGGEYLLLHACKNHDCADNNTTLLYSPARKLVYGKIRLAGRSSLIGAPPPAVAKELGEYWRKEWVHSED